MTQFLAKCLKCGGMVHHLEQTGTVETCDACTPAVELSKEKKSK